MAMIKEEQEPLTATEEEENFRLDKFLALRFPKQSRTYFQYLIEEKLVLVNGELVKKREKLKAGDVIEVEFALTPELSLEPENIPLDIIYEDDDLLVINKPAGLVVHPAPGNWSHTFVNALLYHCKTLKVEGLRPGIVHRLDKDTTGLLVAAKTELAHKRLVEAFASRQVRKEYLAICFGHPKEETIQTLIGRHPTKRKEMSVLQEGGKPAITQCRPLKQLGELSLVQLIIETGRTHQIRVHMKHRGTPVLGDVIYGSERANKKFHAMRQLLHAHKLSFLHPITALPLSFEAPLPADMSFATNGIPVPPHSYPVPISSSDS